MRLGTCRLVGFSSWFAIAVIGGPLEAHAQEAERARSWWVAGSVTIEEGPTSVVEGDQLVPFTERGWSPGERLSRHGRFVRCEAGDTLALLGLEHVSPLTPSQLAHLNGVERDHVFEFAGWVCLERHHRTLPGETLEQLSTAHGVSVEGLAELNGLEPDARLMPWAKLRVPARLRRTSAGDTVFWTLPVLRPRWDLLAGASGALTVDHIFVAHEVASTDDWESLAQKSQTSGEILRSANRSVGVETDGQRRRQVMRDRSLDAGGSVFVHCELEFGSDPSLEAIVAYLCHFLRADLDRVLRLNALQDVEGLLELEVIAVPFSSPGGFDHLQTNGIAHTIRGDGATKVTMQTRLIDGREKLRLVVESNRR